MVITTVSEHIGEPIRDKGSTVTQSEGGSENEAVAAGEIDGRDDAKTRDGDGGEKEGRHTAENRIRDRDDHRGELGKDTGDDEEEAARHTGLAVRATGQADDTIVLREYGHWGDGEESGKDTGETVREDTTLDAGIEKTTGDVEARDIAGSGNVADGFAGEDNVDREHREDHGAVDGEFEGLDPHEACGGGGLDPSRVEVSGSSSDDAADEEADDNGGGFHDGTAETLAENDSSEDGEAETNEFSGSPRKRLWRENVRAHCEDAGLRSTVAGGSAAPVLETRLDKVDSDEHDGRASDERREHLAKNPGRCEGEGDFEESAETGGSEDGAVDVRAGKASTIGANRTAAVGVPLVHSALGDGNDGEGGSDN